MLLLSAAASTGHLGKELSRPMVDGNELDGHSAESMAVKKSFFPQFSYSLFPTAIFQKNF